jgi:hypothetical protein
MSDLFKIPVTQYWLHDCWIDPAGNPCDESTSGARFKDAFRVKKGTPGARKVKTKSTKWYSRINGNATTGVGEHCEHCSVANALRRRRIGRAIAKRDGVNTFRAAACFAWLGSH